MLTDFRCLQTRRDEWEALIRQVTGLGVYIAFSSELRLHVDGIWHGAVSPGLHELIRDELPERYDGRRAAMAIRDPDKSTRIEARIVEFDSLVLHELTHIVENELAGRNAIEIPLQHFPSMKALMEAEDSEPITSGLPPWQGHGADFIRLLLHLHWRFLDAGVVDLCDVWMFPSGLFGLSPLGVYREALRSELGSSLPLDEIVNSPPPQAFTDAIAEDQTAFWELMKRRGAAV